MSATPSKDFKDRRKHNRIKAAVVELALSQEGPFQQPAFIKDIGIGGVCLYFKEEFPRGTVFFLRVHLEDETTPLSAKGKVVWCGKSSYRGYYEVGIELSEVTNDVNQRLSNYVLARLPKTM